MKYLLPLLLLIGCNPVKKVQESESKTQKVVEHYLKTHPFKSDTIFNTLPGEILTYVDIDTVKFVENNTDSFYLDRYHTITKTITKHRVDTLVKTIRDNSFVQALQRTNDLKDGQIELLQKQNKIIGNKADKWKYRSISLLFIILAFVGYKVFRFFKPTINL